MNSKNNIYRIISIIFIVLGTYFLISKNGTTKQKSRPGSTILNIGLNVSSKNVPIQISFLDENNKVNKQNLLSSDIKNQVVVVAFPQVKVLKNLEVKLKGVPDFEIKTINVSSGDFTKNIPSNDLKHNVVLLNSIQKFTNHDLKIKANDSSHFFGLKLNENIDMKSENNTWVFGFIFGFIFLIITSSVLFYYRDNAKQVFIGMLIASFLAGVIKFYMKYMQEEVLNYTMEIQIEKTNKKVIYSRLYYSDNNTFDLHNVILDTLVKRDSSKIHFRLPSKLTRYVRFDLPKNDTLVIESINFSNFLGNNIISNNEINKYFTLQNNVQSFKDKNGKMTFVTGKFDPYIILTKTDFQDKMTAFQYKIIDYPSWGTALLLFIFLPFLCSPKNRKNKIYIILFCTIISIPSFSMLLKLNTLVLDSEKRFANQFPESSVLNFKVFKTELNDYINDQFGGRSVVISKWNTLRILLYNQTSRYSPVVIGRNGWLYYVSSGVKEQYENKFPLTTKTLQKMKKVLEERHYWLKNQGIDYYLVIPAMSLTTYEEYLPKSIMRSDNKPKLDQIYDYLRSTNSPVKFIDLRKPIFDAKEKEEDILYYKSDSHWNHLGAYYGYRAMYERIRLDHPEFEKPKTKSDFDWKKFNTTEGDLAFLLSLQNKFLREEILPIPKKGRKYHEVKSLFYPTYSGIQSIRTYVVKNPKLPKLLISRDSYSNYFVPFLSDHFQRSVYLWTTKFDAQIIKDEKPTIVITEILDRFILDLQKPNPSIVTKELKSIKK